MVGDRKTITLVRENTAPPAAGGPSSHGVVRMGIDIAVPADDVWRALVTSEGNAGWFGDLDRPLEPGQSCRVDFGDGDFFLIDTLVANRPYVLEFQWRFLGIGTPHLVRWDLRDEGKATRVTVTDTDENREADEVAVVTEGWSDFLSRLQRHLEWGEYARYDWRSDIDGAVTLAPGTSPLADDILLHWLPVEVDEGGCRFICAGEGRSQRYKITRWKTEQGSLAFNVQVEAGVPATRCEVVEKANDGGVRLSFWHGGWRELGVADDAARQIRQMFAQMWIQSLHNAEGVTQPTKPPPTKTGI